MLRENNESPVKMGDIAWDDNSATCMSLAEGKILGGNLGPIFPEDAYDIEDGTCINDINYFKDIDGVYYTGCYW